MVEGLHVPVIAGKLVELKGKVVGVVFWQKGPIAAKLGVIEFEIVISIVVVAAH